MPLLFKKNNKIKSWNTLAHVKTTSNSENYRVLQLRKLKQICKHLISFANNLFAIFLADSLSNCQQTAKDHPVYPRENLTVW